MKDLPALERFTDQTWSANPSYEAEAKKSGLSPVFSESLDYISTPACVTCETGRGGMVVSGYRHVGNIINPP